MGSAAVLVAALAAAVTTAALGQQAKAMTAAGIRRATHRLVAVVVVPGLLVGRITFLVARMRVATVFNRQLPDQQIGMPQAAALASPIVLSVLPRLQTALVAWEPILLD